MGQVQLGYYIGNSAERRRLLMLKLGQRDKFVVANSPFCFG